MRILLSTSLEKIVLLANRSLQVFLIVGGSVRFEPHVLYKKGEVLGDTIVLRSHRIEFIYVNLIQESIFYSIFILVSLFLVLYLTLRFLQEIQSESLGVTQTLKY